MGSAVRGLGDAGSDFGEGFEDLDPRINFFLKGDGEQNFGDYLSALICKHLLVSARTQADVFRLIGSVICSTRVREDLRQFLGVESGRIAFWGCGARENKPLPTSTLENCRFYGVRGSLTRTLLGLPEDTVLGDPGLLAPLIVSPSPECETTGKTICIPHMQDPRDSASLLAESGCDAIVSPVVRATERDLVELIQRIASAEFILTGSLHGAIIASAFRKPFAYWNTGFIDIEFKWRDFSSSVGIDTEFVESLAEGRLLYLDKISRQLQLPRVSSLLAVCPFAPKVSAVLSALRYDGMLSAESTEVDIEIVVRNFDAETQRWARKFDDDTITAREYWNSLSAHVRRRAGAWREFVKRPAKRLLHA